MALIECHECGTSISDKAKTCPHCGAKHKRKSKVTKFLLWWLLIGIGTSSFGIISLMSDRIKEVQIERVRIAALTPEQRDAEAKKAAAEKKEEDEASTENFAIYMCRDYLEKSLKDPDSVKYLDGNAGQSAVAEKDGNFRVRIVARAKNSFGALAPSVFQCQLTHAGDKWFLRGLKEFPLQ